MTKAHRNKPKLSALMRELSSTHNLLIMSVFNRPFCPRLHISPMWGKPELQRQPHESLFELTAQSPAKLSPVVTELHSAATIFETKT
jgi:hypothetical protein